MDLEQWNKMQTIPIIENMYRLWDNVLKMLEKRNYDTNSIPKKLSMEAMLQQWELCNQNHPVYFMEWEATHKETKQTITLFFCNEVKIGVNTVRTIHSKMANLKKTHFILLSEEGVTSFTMKEIQDIETKQIEEGFKIEIFQFNEFFFSLLDHQLIPKFTILSEREKQIILKRYGIAEHLYPVFLWKEPIRRYLDLKKGTMIEFLRKNGSQEIGKYYRIVSNKN